MESSVINFVSIDNSLMNGWRLVEEKEKGLYKALNSIAIFNLKKGQYFWDRPDTKSFGLFKPVPSGWLGQSLSGLFLTKDCGTLEQIERVLKAASQRFSEKSICSDLDRLQKELLKIEELDDKQFQEKRKRLEKLIGRFERYSSLFSEEKVSQGLEGLNRYYKGDTPSLVRLGEIVSSTEPLEKLFQKYRGNFFSLSIGFDSALQSRKEKREELLSLFEKGSLPKSSDPELNEVLKSLERPPEDPSFLKLCALQKKWEQAISGYLQKFSESKLSLKEKESRLKAFFEEFSRFPEVKKEIEGHLQKIRGQQLSKIEKAKKRRLDQKIEGFSRAVDRLEADSSQAKEVASQLKALVSRFSEMKALKQFDYFEKYETALFKLDGLPHLDPSLKELLEEAKRLTVRGYLSAYFEGYEKRELILKKALASIRKVQKETPRFLQSEESFKRLPHGKETCYTAMLFREGASKPLKSAYILFKQHQEDGIRPLGKGSFGKVSLSFDLRALKMRAVKTMSSQMGPNVERVHAMEFAGFSKTRGCERIIQLLDLADYSVPLKGFVTGEPVEGAPPLPAAPEIGKYAYFLKLYRHGTLKELLNKKQSLTLEEKKALTSDMLQGLAELKKRGGVLRDIKPENIFLKKERGQPILADLGFFGESERAGESYQLKGTPVYIPPEQLLKPQEGFELEKHDIWSTGLVLHKIWFGSLPAWTKGLSKLDELKPLFENSKFESFEKKEEESISQLLEGMLKKDPSRRFDADQALACFEKLFADGSSKRAV